MAGISEAPDKSRFHELLARRSRLRWGLSGFLITAYFCYSIGGLYLPEAWAQPAFGSGIPLGIALGGLIIVLSIIFAIFYVRIVNDIEADS